VSAAVNVNGGGFADTPNQRILVDPGPSATTAAQIGAAVLATGPGGTVRVGDVAQVADAPAPPVGDALIMGKPGVLLTLSSQYGANTLDTTRALERAIDDLAPALRAQG
jgi:multidrug efflux pump subunit AcrB